ncbi:MAG: hypothetical protein WC123_02455 [Bacilli bacterium]|nr:hypothetical protein [Bacilli bacterium]
MESQITYKKLTVKDEKTIKLLCLKRKKYNFFILSNLNLLAKKQNLVEYFGVYEEKELVGVIMFFHKLLYYEIKEKKYFKNIIDLLLYTDKNEIIINDTYDLYNRNYFTPKYHEEFIKPGLLFQYYDNKLINEKEEPKALLANIDNIESLVDFYNSAPIDIKRGKDSLLRSITNGRRTFFTKKNGIVSSCILTTGETNDSAMLGGIHYICNKDLIIATNSIIESLIKENKKLIYTVIRDEKVISILKKIGFIKLGNWNIIHLKSD